MSSTSSKPGSSVTSRGVEFARWPLRDSPWTTSGRLAGLLALAAIAAWSLDRPWTAAAIGPLLLLTVWRLWLPIRYGIGPRGITERTIFLKRRIAWNEIAAIEHRPRGIFVVANAPRPFPGVARTAWIPFPADQVDRLRALCDAFGPGGDADRPAPPA
ncbi:MAG: YcxB family protein [Planctomycetes bacterium]|nr:YcxB family protein [Planctomycetota bacterium]